VRGRFPTDWNIILRLTTILTAFPLSRGRCGKRHCVQGHSLLPNPEPELGDDTDILFRQSEHLRQHAPQVDHAL